MHYTDIDIIRKTLNDTSRRLTFAMICEYIEIVSISDLYLPYREYTDLLLIFPYHIHGDRDSNNRPMFQIGGIRFYALSREEAAKYSILK